MLETEEPNVERRSALGQMQEGKVFKHYSYMYLCEKI